MLHHCNFSFKKLSRVVPKGGISKNIGAMEFIGNRNLHGPWVSLPPCQVHKHQSVWNTKRVIIPMVILIMVVALCVFLGILRIQNSKKHTQREDGTSFTIGNRRISYGDIMIATNEFSDAIFLGVGSFGKVYKWFLNDAQLLLSSLSTWKMRGATRVLTRN